MGKREPIRVWSIEALAVEVGVSAPALRWWLKRGVIAPSFVVRGPVYETAIFSATDVRRVRAVVAKRLRTRQEWQLTNPNGERSES